MPNRLLLATLAVVCLLAGWLASQSRPAAAQTEDEPTNYLQFSSSDPPSQQPEIGVLDQMAVARYLADTGIDADDYRIAAFVARRLEAEGYRPSDLPRSRSSVLSTVVIVVLTNLVLLAAWRGSSAWRRRIGIGLIVLVAAMPAQAQTDWHVYGGRCAGREQGEAHRGSGWGRSVGRLPLWRGRHPRPRPERRGTGELQALAAGTGIDLTYEAYGADGVIGFVGRRPGALIIPALVFGYTTGEAQGCIGGADCLSERVGQVNYGFEIIAAATGNTGSGIRASYRYGRNYGKCAVHRLDVLMVQDWSTVPGHDRQSGDSVGVSMLSTESESS